MPCAPLHVMHPAPTVGIPSNLHLPTTVVPLANPALQHVRAAGLVHFAVPTKAQVDLALGDPHLQLAAAQMPEHKSVLDPAQCQASVVAEAWASQRCSSTR
mmetsp:Transcript_24399/g.69964  ORF Transcript_24399/g.69964 Transcript_24399/m.69964 type:complete len:101 (+) Transcript_24399:1695-1997(+)